MLRIGLRNLLQNAFTYSQPEKTVSIEFGMHHSTGAYFVRDKGVGFDMNFCPQIFKPFSRLHHQTEFEGSGMGLAVVKRIMERHGGWIWAEARPRGGAIFYFTLGPGASVDGLGQTGGGDGRVVAIAG
jgi:light-regulated signal transduction histidine kinase (bacteriophytochrome)